jgi:hypothetical protein
VPAPLSHPGGWWYLNSSGFPDSSPAAWANARNASATVSCVRQDLQCRGQVRHSHRAAQRRCRERAALGACCLAGAGSSSLAAGSSDQVVTAVTERLLARTASTAEEAAACARPVPTSVPTSGQGAVGVDLARDDAVAVDAQSGPAHSHRLPSADEAAISCPASISYHDMLVIR